MGADILERLELMLHARLMDEDAIIREAAAEIVRLRGEVERQESSHGNTIDQRDRAHEMIDSVYAAVMDAFPEWSSAYGFADALNDIEDRIHTIRTATPAPAMPNGVEGLVAQLRGELAHDKGWNHTEYEKGRIAEKERCISLLNDLPKSEIDADAVPAGEAVAVYEGNPCVECGEDTGTGHFPGCCLGTTPQPADVEAVAPLGYVRRKAISAMREDDEVTGIMVHVDAPSDSVPVYLHPPAPVQAATQEGGTPLAEVHEYMNQRVAHDVAAFRRAAHHSACELGELAAVAVKCGAYEYGDPSNRYYDFSSEQLQAFVAALQHRGDSRGGEG